MVGKNKKLYGSHFQLIPRPGESDGLDNVKLPDKLRCVRCQKWMGHQNFSRKQLLDAKLMRLNRGPHASFSIKCRGCAGGPVVEIECTMCHETKGLEEFAKSQRTKPDCARCMKCMDSHLELDAVVEEKYEDPREAYETVAVTSGPYPDYWNPSASGLHSSTAASNFDNDIHSDAAGGVPLTNHFAELAITDSTLVSGSNGFSSMDRAAEDDGWNVAKPKSWRTKSHSRPADSAITTFDPTKYGHPSSNSGRSGSVFASNATANTDIKVGKSGWAKIKAYKPEPKQEEPEKEFDDDWASDDDEGADDDDSGSERSL